ncbi:MalY/PatB family protein [Ruminococcus albus]|uniref:cysteine-S-conjugate beta-lyase n=1 Tax=Ruminococcus albus TaxID=1264 RepID=A0A1I1JEK6_RUMAL|nr:MalY/PatB family protein [Ruminococcus albus]SFC46987.1 cystathione beta-lyase [Ruminococcus albus]
MNYDFDHITDRSGTDSLKWNTAPGELPMWVADMDFPAAPTVLEALQKRLSNGVLGYSDIPDEWYGAYSSWWTKRHGVNFQRSHLLFSPGVLPTICTAIQELTDAGDNIVVFSPVYNCFYDCITSNRRTVLECPLTEEDLTYCIDFTLLEQQFSLPQTTMLLLSNPHNPTGNIWDKDTLAHIGDLARKHNVIVLSDEIHCDLTDPDICYVPYLSASPQRAENSIICISPTKTFNLAGIQTSAVVVPDSNLRRKIRDGLHSRRIDYPNLFAAQAAVAAFTNGGEWLDELRKYLYGNKELVRDFLISNLPEIKLTPSQATYLLWLDARALKPDPGMTLAQSIRRRTGLYLSEGTQFGTGGKGFLRMNIACPRSMVRDGLERLARAVSEMTASE